MPQIITQLVWAALVIMAVKCEAGCCLGCIGILNLIIAVIWGILAIITTIFGVLVDADGDEDIEKFKKTMTLMAVALWILVIFKCVAGCYWFRIATTIQSRTVTIAQQSAAV